MDQNEKLNILKELPGTHKCPKNKAIDSREVLVNGQSLFPNIDVNDFERKAIDNKSVEVPNIVKAVADNDELKSKISKIIDDPNVNEANNVGVQRHLHSKNKVNLNSQMGDLKLRGNLSKKFKPSKSKLQQGTPEKCSKKLG